MSNEQHFIDTSVARLFLISPSAYKNYLESVIPDDRRHVNKFILMEFRRGLIIPLVEFLHYLDFPNIKTVDDAMKLWAERFEIRSIKSGLSVIPQICSSKKIDLSDPSHRQKAIRAIAEYIVLLDVKFRKIFKFTGQDAVRCERADVDIESDNDNQLLNCLNGFHKRFSNTKQCRDKCDISNFFKTKFKKEVSLLVGCRNKLAIDENRTKASYQGFDTVIDKMCKPIEGKSTQFSCHYCGFIGDVVIALESPQDQILDHTDASFNDLCDCLKKEHFQHPSVSSFMKNG